MTNANNSKVLTNNQRKFAEEYLKCGNATQAYKNAYSSCKKDSTARTNGARLLANTDVRTYINAINAITTNNNIMTIQEIKETYTRIARDEEVDCIARVRALDSLVKVSTLTEAESKKLEIETAKLQLEKEKLEKLEKQQQIDKDIKVTLVGADLEKWSK